MAGGQIAVPEGVPIPEKNGKIPEYLRYSYLGFQFAAVIFICAYGGSWLDKKLGIEPVLTLGGFLLGSVIGIYVLYEETKGIHS